MATADLPTAAAPPAAPTPTGHPTGFWFFFWGEFAERCSYYGMRAILALYMTDKLGVSKADAGTYMSLFIAACYFFPLVGGYIADRYFGKYWTIVGFSLPYVVAQFLVGVENQYLVLLSLLLLAMGSGVIKPNISTLMGMTYQQQRPGQDQLRTSAFSWFYMAINIGAALSQITMPWLRNEYGYQAAFLFPAACMSVALLVFALGKRFYAAEQIVIPVVGRPGVAPPADGTTATGVPVKYKVVTPAELAADKAMKRIVLSRIGAVFLTVMFFWAIFDQSASTWIFFADTYMDCTLFGIPTSADAIQAFNAVFIVLLVPVSVWLFKTLDRKGMHVTPTRKLVLGFGFTGLSMVIMSVAGFLAGQKQDAVKLTTPEGDLVLPAATVPLAEVTGTATLSLGNAALTSANWTYDKEKKKLTFADGTLTLPGGKTLAVTGGHLPAGAADLAAGGVLESKLKAGDALAKVKADATRAGVEKVDWVAPAERVTVWWKVLAFFIITVGEILISITGLQLAFEAAPESMKGFVTACWLAVVFLANLLINAPITRLYPLLEPGVYFAMLAGAMAVVIVVFLPIAAKFNRAMALLAKEKADAVAAAGQAV